MYGARVEIVAANRLAVPFTVTADAIGRFHAERDLDPLVICAKSPDGKLGAIVEVGAEDPEIVIAVAPTATPTGVLLDLDGKPAANQALEWGKRVFLNEEESMSMLCFAPKVVTDATGRFILRDLVVGQDYEISLFKNKIYRAGIAQPNKPTLIDLGTLRAGAYRHRSRTPRAEMSPFAKAPAPGVMAPPVRAIMLDGKPLTLGDFKGKYVLLDFWATWWWPLYRRNPSAPGRSRRLR